MYKNKPLLELITHAKNYIGGEILSKGIGYLGILIYSQIMSTGEFGTLSISFSLLALFSIFYSLGIRGAITRYYFEKHNDFQSFLSSNLILFILWSILITFIFIALRDPIISFFIIPKFLFNFLLFIGFSVSLFELFLSYLQTKKLSKTYGIAVLIKSIIVFCLGLTLTFSLESKLFYGPIYGMTISWVIGLILLSYLIYKKVNYDFNIKHIKYTLIFSIPIFFHLISQNILNTFDQVIINQEIGSKFVGIYSFAYQVSVIQLFVILAILKSWTPIFYERMNAKEHKIIESLIINKSTIITISSITIMIFSEIILRLFVSTRYASSFELIPILITGYFMFYLYTVYANYSFYLKKTVSVSIITLITGGINVFLNYLFIPIYGIEAAAWTTLVSFTIMFIMNFIISKSYLNIVTMPLRGLVLNCIIIILILALCLGLSKIEMNSILDFLIRVLSFFICSYLLIIKMKKHGGSIK